MAAANEQQLGIQGQGMTRSLSFSDWSGAESSVWNDEGRSFAMLKNMTAKPHVKIEPTSDEPLHPVIHSVVPKGPRSQRKDPRKAPNQRAATPARGPQPEHNTRPTCLGIKRKEPDEYLPTLSTLEINTLIVKTTDRRFCEICQLSCSSDLNFRDHLVGAQHKSKVEYEERKYSCNLCRIVCPDGVTLNKHLIGKKHMAAQKKMEDGMPKPFYCELCMVSCQNKDIFQAHLDGKLHAAKLKMLE